MDHEAPWALEVDGFKSKDLLLFIFDRPADDEYQDFQSFYCGAWLVI